MLYHPDKNNEDPYSLTKFNEIKEAYETLINPRKKELYLQERWLYRAKGRKPGEQIITPPNILIQSLELNKAIAALDIHRMDHAGAAGKINLLLHDEVIEKLLEFNETEINQSIIYSLLKATANLPLKETTEVAERLLRLAKKDPRATEKIQQLLQRKKQQLQWDRYRALGIIFLTIAICLLIWFAGRG